MIGAVSKWAVLYREWVINQCATTEKLESREEVSRAERVGAPNLMVSVLPLPTGTSYGKMEIF